jgi:membrane protein involved in colicin uptake
MDPNAIYTKTPRGVSEVKHRAARLSRNLLSVLTLIDGKSPVGQLLQSAKLPEIKFRGAINELEEEGFIRVAATGSEIRGEPAPAGVANRLPAARNAGLDELDFTSMTRSALADRNGNARAPALVGTAPPSAAPIAAGEVGGAPDAEARAGSEREIRRLSDQLARAKEAAEAHEKAEAEARVRAEAQMRAEAEARARMAAEVDARMKAEARARLEVHRKAEAEKKARAEAERRAEEERKAREMLEARLESERQAREEAERKARGDAERREKEEAESRVAAERKARETEEQLAREAAERRAAEARLAEERQARGEAEHRAREEAQAIARKEIEAKLADERRAREALEAKLADEREAKHQAERRAREEAEQREKDEAERREREESERSAREAAERKAREELEAKLAAECKAKEEAERKALAEAERHAREEAESRAREEVERKAREATEQQAKEQAHRWAAEEAQRKAEAGAERHAREEAERHATEEAARHAQEAAEQAARAEAEAKALADAADLAQAAAPTRSVGEAELAQETAAATLTGEEATGSAAELVLEPCGPLSAPGHDEQGSETESTRLLAPCIDLSTNVAETSAAAEENKAPQPTAAVPSEPGLGEGGSLFVIDLDALDAQERQLRAEEEEKLRVEAQRHAREVEAREGAEREAREHAELLQRESEEIARRTVEEAERQAQEEERRQREEEERRGREESARKAREEQERQLREEAERRDREDAEARTRADEARKAEEQEARRRAREEEKERKQREADAKADATARTKVDAKREGRGAKKASKWSRPVALSAIVLVLGALGLLHVVPLTGYGPAMEELAASALGEPVKIGSVHAALLPYPHFKLEGVTVGKEQNLKIASVRAVPELSTLFGPQKTLSVLELQSVNADPEVLRRAPSWIRTDVPRSLRVSKVVLREVKIDTARTPLPTFDGEVSLNENNALVKASFRTQNGDLKVDLRNRSDELEAEFTARGWKPPIGPGLQFDEIAGKVRAASGAITFSDVSARLYGGSATGHGRLTWNGPWSLTGEFSTRQLDLVTALKAFTGQFRATGRIDASGRYTMQSAALDRLFGEPQVEAAFKVERGELENVDLTRALQQAAAGTPVRGGKTQFAELSGTVSVSGKRYQYRQLALASGILIAHGTTDLVASGDLAGRVNLELSAKPNPIRAVLAVSGKLADPQLRPSR